MTTKITPISVKVGDGILEGNFLAPAAPIPGILFIHGWGGSQQFDLRRAQTITGLGCVCLTFDLTGHNATVSEREDVTRDQNMNDVCAAYDTLLTHPFVDPQFIAVVGHSYGAYLAALLTEMRSVRWLSLLAPALYQDEQWFTPKEQLNPQFLRNYRNRTHCPSDNEALHACSLFKGDVLILEAANDEIIPQRTLLNYRQAFTRSGSLTHRVLDQADHGLKLKTAQRDYSTFLYHWIQEMITRARVGHIGGQR